MSAQATPAVAVEMSEPPVIVPTFGTLGMGTDRDAGAVSAGTDRFHSETGDPWMTRRTDHVDGDAVRTVNPSVSVVPL